MADLAGGKGHQLLLPLPIRSLSRKTKERITEKEVEMYKQVVTSSPATEAIVQHSQYVVLLL